MALEGQGTVMVKVWKEEDIFGNENVGYPCAWKDCEARFKGDMPHGWVWLLTYWAPEPQLSHYAVPQRHMPRDAALCPRHNEALEQLLIDIPQLLRERSAGRA
jgi:hypothetical protein